MQAPTTETSTSIRPNKAEQLFKTCKRCGAIQQRRRVYVDGRDTGKLGNWTRCQCSSEAS